MEQGGEQFSDPGVGTMRGRDYPTIRQFSIFAPNKVGQLLALMRLLETAKIRVCALSIIDTIECAIIRLVCTQPERAYELLEQAGYKFCEVDLLVIEVPHNQYPMMSICHTLLRAEVNIHYTYPVLVKSLTPALAFFVDDLDTATRVLDQEGFVVLSENCLED